VVGSPLKKPVGEVANGGSPRSSSAQGRVSNVNGWDLESGWPSRLGAGGYEDEEEGGRVYVRIGADRKTVGMIYELRVGVGRVGTVVRMLMAN
jgi:hypothetical protein